MRQARGNVSLKNYFRIVFASGPARILKSWIGETENVFGSDFFRCSWSSNRRIAGTCRGGPSKSASKSGETFLLGGDLLVNRLGFGAMRLTGEGIWGWPPDRENAKKVLRRAVELGVNFIDTADAYGPEMNELLIAEALYPYPKGLIIATKSGQTRPGPSQWEQDGRPEYLAQCVDKVSSD